MERHGHVTPLPDGLKARCGGPALCAICKLELSELENSRLREELADTTRQLLAQEISKRVTQSSLVHCQEMRQQDFKESTSLREEITQLREMQRVLASLVTEGDFRGWKSENIEAARVLLKYPPKD